MALDSSWDMSSVKSQILVNTIAANLLSSVGIIRYYFLFESTHHPTNNKPHECVWLLVLNENVFLIGH